MTESNPASATPSPLPPEAFSVRPDVEVCRRVARSYRALMISELERAVAHAEAGLQAEVPLLRERIRALDSSKRLSPALFRGFTRLTDAFAAQRSDHVADALQWLCALDLEAMTDARFRLGSILEEHWEAPFIDELRKPPTGQHKEGDVVLEPLLETDLSEFASIHEDCLRLIEESDAGLYEEAVTYVTRLKLFAGRGIAAFSSPRVFGAVFLRLPEPEVPLGPYWLEHIAHETSHLALNALSAHAPLLENPGEIHEAPIRPDPRPLYQVLHGTFVLSRQLRLLTEISQNQPDSFDAEGPLEETREAYSRGYDTLRAFARWTEPGARLFDSFAAS